MGAVTPKWAIVVPLRMIWTVFDLRTAKSKYAGFSEDPWPPVVGAALEVEVTPVPWTVPDAREDCSCVAAVAFFKCWSFSRDRFCRLFKWSMALLWGWYSEAGRYKTPKKKHNETTSAMIWKPNLQLFVLCCQNRFRMRSRQAVVKLSKKQHWHARTQKFDWEVSDKTCRKIRHEWQEMMMQQPQCVTDAGLRDSCLMLRVNYDVEFLRKGFYLGWDTGLRRMKFVFRKKQLNPSLTTTLPTKLRRKMRWLLFLSKRAK